MQGRFLPGVAIPVTRLPGDGRTGHVRFRCRFFDFNIVFEPAFNVVDGFLNTFVVVHPEYSCSDTFGGGVGRVST